MNATQIICQKVKSKLEAGAWQHGERMPSLAEMAKMFSVSRSTMFRTLKVLQASSLVHANPGGAIFAGPRESHHAQSVSKGLIWQRLKARIGQDLLTNAFTGPALPSTSKLARTYGVSINTLKKSLAQLVSEGMLSNNGHRYVLSSGHSHRFLSKAVLIGAGTEGNINALSDLRTEKVIENFERDCMRMGYGSRLIGFDDSKPASLLEISRNLASMESIAGFVVCVWNPSEEPRRNRWYDIINHLSRKKTPVIILDLAGNFSLPDHISRLENLRILRIASFRAGEMMADMLLGQGHHRIAYLSVYMNYYWAQERYAGLCRHCRQYGGLKAKVELFSRDEFIDISELTLEILDIDEESIRLIFGDFYTANGLEGLMKAADRIKQRHLLQINPDDPRVATVKAGALHLRDLARFPHDPPTLNKLLTALIDRASTYALEMYLESFFDMVLKKSQSTAWVFSDDKTAATALDFLRRRGKPVPRDLSIASFDNWQEAPALGLSTYDFNMHGMVQQALLMIRDEKSLKNKPAISEVDGYVIERRSSKKNTAAK